MDLELASKRAIVTGGRQGIGRAIAAALAAEGAQVVIASRDGEGLAKTAHELREMTGGQVEAHVVDTRSAESVAALVQATVASWGGVDILVNNAATVISGPTSTLESPPETVASAFDDKVLGYLRCAQAVLPHMIAGGWGRIINVGGLSARHVGSLASSIRNSAVTLLSKNIADENGAQFAGSTLQLPQNVEDLSQLPAYLVPPDTTGLSLTASTTTPAQVELSSPGGGIDVFGDLQSAQKGSTLSTASVTESAGSLGLGYWFPYVQQIGPFGDSGAPSATSVLSATAVTKSFDPAVKTSTGDPFTVTIDPTADPGAPLLIAPGQTATITVSITPTGAKGSEHSGVLNLVTTPIGVAGLFNTTGEVLASLPYRYTIG